MEIDVTDCVEMNQTPENASEIQNGDCERSDMYLSLELLHSLSDSQKRHFFHLMGHMTAVIRMLIDYFAKDRYILYAYNHFSFIHTATTLSRVGLSTSFSSLERQREV